jgi:creatinine amidohydrolase/Fe(II)-dependent formamide hydrolase-like protein
MGFRPERFGGAYFGRSPEEQVQFYRDLLYHLMVQMNTLEMRAVCLLCGHYPIYEWAAPVVERFNAAFADTRAFAGIEFHYPPESDEVGGDHAAKWETSYLWYLRPDCVDMSVYLGREEEPLVGVMGEDPRQHATIEIGRRACDLIVEGMVRKARALLAQAGFDTGGAP